MRERKALCTPTSCSSPGETGHTQWQKDTLEAGSEPNGDIHGSQLCLPRLGMNVATWHQEPQDPAVRPLSSSGTSIDMTALSGLRPFLFRSLFYYVFDLLMNK